MTMPPASRRGEFVDSLGDCRFLHCLDHRAILPNGYCRVNETLSSSYHLKGFSFTSTPKRILRGHVREFWDVAGIFISPWKLHGLSRWRHHSLFDLHHCPQPKIIRLNSITGFMRTHLPTCVIPIWWQFLASQRSQLASGWDSPANHNNLKSALTAFVESNTKRWRGNVSSRPRGGCNRFST